MWRSPHALLIPQVPAQKLAILLRLGVHNPDWSKIAWSEGMGMPQTGEIRSSTWKHWADSYRQAAKSRGCVGSYGEPPDPHAASVPNSGWWYQRKGNYFPGNVTCTFSCTTTGVSSSRRQRCSQHKQILELLHSFGVSALLLLLFQIQSCVYCSFEGVPRVCIPHSVAKATLLIRQQSAFCPLHFLTVT